MDFQKLTSVRQFQQNEPELGNQIEDAIKEILSKFLQDECTEIVSKVTTRTIMVTPLQPTGVSITIQLAIQVVDKPKSN